MGFTPRTGELVESLKNGTYVTLRLTSSMYHRFHAPADATLTHVTHISGDTWNVNPIALKRVEQLFCKNERAVLNFKLTDGTPMIMVPVAAILVASLRLHAVNLLFHVDYTGPNEIPCATQSYKGKNLDGSNTDPPFWFLYLKGSNWQKVFQRANASRWVRLYWKS